jgi:hypothetical protein
MDDAATLEADARREQERIQEREREKRAKV